VPVGRSVVSDQPAIRQRWVRRGHDPRMGEEA
jgi:hypothetical protein